MSRIGSNISAGRGWSLGLASALLMGVAGCSSNAPPVLPPPDAGPSSDGGENDAGPDAGVDAGNDLPSQNDLASLIDPILDGGFVSGMVIGLIDPTGQVVYGYGEAIDGSGQPPSGTTLFEIGSVTKSLTALWVLSGMDGGAQLDDPVKGYLPGWTLPSRGGVEITLRMLADHTSGLEPDPANLAPADQMNPFADYSVTNLQHELSTEALLFTPGTQFSYSNEGYGLLGYAWGVGLGRDYESATVSDLLQPLGMPDTVYDLAQEQESRFAQGHDGDLNPIEHWTATPALAGAGFLRSTANDLLRLIAVEVGLAPSVFGAQIALSQVPQFGPFAYGPVTTRSTLGLFLNSDGTFWKGGDTAGFSTFMGFDLAQRRGVIVISNSSFGTHDLLGLGLLSLWAGGNPQSVVPATLNETDTQLDRFVGTFAFTPSGYPTFFISFSVVANHLVAQTAGSGPLKLYAESDGTFYARVADVWFVFAANNTGQFTTVTFEQNGTSAIGTKQ